MTTPRVRSRRFACAVLPLALLLAAPPASAAGTPAADFKKAAKAAIKSLAAQSKTTTKTVKAGLKAAATGYGGGTLDASAALDRAVVSVTAQRDAMEDAALEAVTQLAAGGATLLRDSGTTEPGADFQAGGRGTWDDAVDSVDSILDASDDQIAAAFAKFVKDMAKGAKKRHAVVDIRALVPAHGGAVRSVEPPATGKHAVARDIDQRPPQVLIAARMVETTRSGALDLGVRFDGPSVGVVASSTGSEQLGLGTLNLGAGGTATGSFDLSGLANADRFVKVVLDATSQRSAATVISAPRLTAAPGAAAAITKQFGADLKDAGKSLSETWDGALSFLATRLASHVAAVTSGAATAQLAIETGWTDLRIARSAVGNAFRQAHAGPVAAARTALMGAGLGDADLPADLAPDAAGVYGAAHASMATAFEKCQDAATRQYDAFAATILALARQKGQSIGAGLVVGRTAVPAAPMITLAGSPPLEDLANPRITDAVVLRVRPAVGPDGFSVLMIVETDPVRFPQLTAGAVTIPDGTSIVLGGLVSDAGGTAQTQVPLLGDLPILGWFFRAESATSPRSDLIILTKPTLVTTGN